MFDLTAVPYLAIRCLKQLAEDEGHRFPRAAQVLQQDFYVDDALTGADTKYEVRTLRTELAELLRLAGLNIPNGHQMTTNCYMGSSQKKQTINNSWAIRKP